MWIVECHILYTYYTSIHRAKVLTCSNLVLILQFCFVLGNIVLELLFILLEAFHHLKIVIKQRPRKISRPHNLLGSLIFSVNVCKGRLHILQKKSTVIKEKAQRCPAAPIFFLKRSMSLFTWRSSTACSFSCCIFDTCKKKQVKARFPWKQKSIVSENSWTSASSAFLSLSLSAISSEMVFSYSFNTWAVFRVHD